MVASLGGCGSVEPVLESTWVSEDTLYATYTGSCGQPRLSWAGTFDRQSRKTRLELEFSGDEDGYDCSREAALDLRPIAAAFADTVYGGGYEAIGLLVPSDASNQAFSSVEYWPMLERACGFPSAAGLVPSFAADGFVKASGIEFESCGREWVRSDCCEPRAAGYDCLLRALESCAPARFGEAYGTVEGDPIFIDYFVVAAESGCQVMAMTDRAQDSFRDERGEAVVTSYCASASLRIATGSECPELVLDDCGL